MPSESKRRLALAIIDFLNTCSTDGSVGADESESIEVAKQIIADAFQVDPNDAGAMQDALGGQSLLSIYGVFERMKGRTASTASKATKSATPAPPEPEQPPPPQYTPSDAHKAEAEKLKGEGNQAMAKKEYATAIGFYSKALEIVPGNPIYLSNRAAAHSASGQHSLAVIDAQAAVDSDPKYTKAWSRLGLAKFALGDTKGSMLAYEKGMAAEGATPSDAMKRGYETAKRRLEEEGGSAESPPRTTSPGAGTRGPGGGGMPDLGSLASMLGGGGGGPMDFGSLLSNPMFAQMAQKVMSNPGMMNSIMNNPKLRDMMEGAGGGGGMPDLGSLMSDPSIADIAKNLMGGGSGSGGSNH